MTLIVDTTWNERKTRSLFLNGIENISLVEKIPGRS